MPPAVIDAMTVFRRQLDQHAEQQARRMAAAWLTATRGLEAEADALAREIAERAAQGRRLRRIDVMRQERYQALAAQMRAQVARFADVAERETAEAQALLGRLALQHSQTLIDAAGGGAQILGQFNRLPVDAFANMVGNTGAGTPLGTLLRTLPNNAVDGMTDALLRSIALGWNPARTSVAMNEAAGVALERAILIARTEQMRVYRAASMDQYRASGVVVGYRRVAAKSPRTCFACLMLDGRMYDLAEDMFDHPAGRCVAVPVVDDRPRAVEWTTGETYFLNQSETDQMRLLGPARYNAWRAGRVSLSDMVTVVDDPVWGKSPRVTPLASLFTR